MDIFLEHGCLLKQKYFPEQGCLPEQRCLSSGTQLKVKKKTLSVKNPGRVHKMCRIEMCRIEMCRIEMCRIKLFFQIVRNGRHHPDFLDIRCIAVPVLYAECPLTCILDLSKSAS